MSGTPPKAQPQSAEIATRLAEMIEAADINPPPPQDMTREGEQLVRLRSDGHNKNAGKFGKEPWEDTCKIDDPASCCYVLVCPCCARRDIGLMLGKGILVGATDTPASRYASFEGQLLNLLTYFTVPPVPIGAILGLMLCPDYICCFYDSNLLKAVAVGLNKDSASPDPCGEEEWGGPSCQMCCCCPCTYCLMYSEVNAAYKRVPSSMEHGYRW